MPLEIDLNIEFSRIVIWNHKFPRMKLKNYLLSLVLFSQLKTVFSIRREKKHGVLSISLLLLAILLNTSSYSQTLKPFTVRYSTELKGDMLVIGNNILGKDNNPLNDNTTNESISMQYIDIDSDPSTFNSSSADLAVPSTVECFKIAYAGLYWGALIKTGESRTDINKIKFKTPGSSTYTDLTGTIIYNDPSKPIAPDDNKPYACYYDVTSIISGLTSPQGTYTVANVQSSRGDNGTTGLAAGWTLYVIYEDPKTTTKYMVSYDGFSALYDDSTLNIDVNGFQTPPSGPINLKFGFAALNGDKSSNNKNQTKVEISNGTANGTSLETNTRPSNYFFNSSITNLDSYITARNPNGTNSLGYDTGIEQLLGVNKSTVGNNATNVRVTLQVAKGHANPIFSFFNAFQVNVISPDIALTKLVKDISGNDIGNTDVELGTNLYYEIGFQSTGNDHVTNFTLKDVLPKNVIFNYPADITSLPVGVTHTYNATTRQLIFTIPDNLVEIGDVAQTIRLHVQLVSNYKDLLDACSNEIKNQAFASYRGVINTTPRVDEGSFASTICNFGTPSSTNFLVNIDGQTFSSNEVLCGASVQLSGPDGYDSYSWSTSPTGTPVIGTNQNYNGIDTGTYYITSTSPCATVTEAITVNPFGNTITNPVIPYADDVVTCPNNGKPLPYIFLCGANATRYIQTNISDASTIVWEKLDENSCAAMTVPNCANESTSCQWNIVGTGANYLANISGQFRVTLRYPGGCFSRFYFNVYQNLLNPKETHNDIICNTIGQIFPVAPGTYAYFVRDSNGCTSVISNQIKIDPLPPLTIDIDRTNAVINCAGDNTGVIVATAQGGLGNYSYTLLDGSGATVQGPSTSGNFTDLIAGDYQVKVDSGDCTTTSSMITITQPSTPLTATYAINEVTCNGANNGILTISASGGTGIIKYAISPNSNQFFDTNIFDNLAPGNYDVIVQDVLGCYVTYNFDITEPAPIRATTITGTIIPEICFGDLDGAFSIDVTGGVLPYSVILDDPTGTYTTGATTQTQFDFNGLSGGMHTVYIQDVNGCSYEWEVALPESVFIDPIATVDYSCVNNAASNSVTVTVDSSITDPTDLDYSLDGGPYQASNVFTNVAPGMDHYIDVRHTNGCIQRTTEFDILQVDPLALALSDGGLNEIVATATGGGGGYQYTFNGESTGTKNTYIIYKSGDYTVEVMDSNGCVATETRYFEYIDVCIPNYFTPNGDGISDGWAPGCTVNYKDLTFDIFDRYGRKIATYRLGQQWDGKYNGEELPSGDYWFVVKLNDLKDNREFVGHFTLYR